MRSSVADRATRELLDGLSQRVDELLDTGAEPADGRDASVVLREIESIARRVDAARLDAMDSIDRQSLHRADGFFSAKVMARHVAKLSNGEAAARSKALKALRDLPQVRSEYRAGNLGTDQLKLLGRVHGNARVRDAMEGSQRWFLDIAQRMSYADFEVEIRQWERLIDEDGPEPNDRAHRNRDAKLIQNDLDLTWEMAGRFAALQGSNMREIFDRYIAAELLTDWEKARAEHGDAATESHLTRTEAQRRADAMWQIFQDAAAAPGSAVPADFVHNIVWSFEAYEEMLRRFDGDDPEPLDPDTSRCETIDGTPLEPIEAAANSLVSKVRRVVIDSAGVVIDLGRARFFTGSTRTAVQLSQKHCPWPGCAVPTTRCEIDHLHDHTKGGQTTPSNGAPLCGRHNRWKQKGFRVSRDPTGGWHVYRPDRTRIE